MAASMVAMAAIMVAMAAIMVAMAAILVAIWLLSWLLYGCYHGCYGCNHGCHAKRNTPTSCSLEKYKLSILKRVLIHGEYICTVNKGNVNYCILHTCSCIDCYNAGFQRNSTETPQTDREKIKLRNWI